MTSKSKVKQLQKQYDRITNANDRPQLIRYITQDRRLIDKKGCLLNESETRKIEKENEEAMRNGSMIVYLTNFSTPQTRIPSSQ